MGNDVIKTTEERVDILYNRIEELEYQLIKLENRLKYYLENE